jgi:hypothetical protein
MNRSGFPTGRKLVTLKYAIAWPAKEIPKSEHGMKEVHPAAHCVTEAAENGGPLLFARMGMLQAINRHKPVNSTRNATARTGEGESSRKHLARRARTGIFSKPEF